MRITPPLILGGGPAGAVAAIRLARAGFPPLVIERTVEPGDALCGGFLSWRSIETLARLGIDPALLGGEEVSRVRLFAGKRSAEAALPRPARGISRRRLDSLLLDAAAQAGAKVERGAGVRVLEDDSVRLDDGATLRSETIFLATGKHDLRGAMRPADARGSDPAIGLRTRFGPAPGLSRMLDGAIELHLFDRGYAGLVLHEDASANLCMAVHRSRLAEAGDAEALLAAIAGECPDLARRLEYREAGTAIDAVANVPYGWRATGTRSGLFRLGDQAGVIPSLAGEGMSIAVASGLYAAGAWLTGGAGAAPGYQRDFAGRIARPLAVAGMIRDLAEAPATAPWMVRAASWLPPIVGAAARLTRVNQEVIDEALAAPHI
ncbi:NAD(P)/FAD-dependent oxidoreductase [Stakelama marina]|uniref:FAD-dependent monooxygenase n=1 Tax=Stakelama marina TaxID=2826939 RepID=A0A8T4ILD0_9SPHN|nr:FAD-dependent monooxygenase [Stakelama marina]MBR0552966.1 FAD-dependent monooxygenase [Stakelama marina]